MMSDAVCMFMGRDWVVCSGRPVKTGKRSAQRSGLMNGRQLSDNDRNVCALP